MNFLEGDYSKGYVDGNVNVIKDASIVPSILMKLPGGTSFLNLTQDGNLDHVRIENGTLEILHHFDVELPPFGNLTHGIFDREYGQIWITMFDKEANRSVLFVSDYLGIYPKLLGIEDEKNNDPLRFSNPSPTFLSEPGRMFRGMCINERYRLFFVTEAAIDPDDGDDNGNLYVWSLNNVNYFYIIRSTAPLNPWDCASFDDQLAVTDFKNGTIIVSTLRQVVPSAPAVVPKQTRLVADETLISLPSGLYFDIVGNLIVTGRNSIDVFSLVSLSSNDTSPSFRRMWTTSVTDFECCNKAIAVVGDKNTRIYIVVS